MLGKKIINTGGVACTTDTTQILDAQLTQSTALYRFEDNANDTASGTGKFNKGAVFNGSNSQILLPNSFDSALGNNNFSYSFWINGPMTSTNKIWYSFAQNYFIYFGYFSSQIYISLYNDTFSTGVTLSANTWTHIAFVKSSTAGIKIYKDGVSAYTSTTSAATNNLGTSGNGQVNVIGRYSGSGYDFDGKLDQVRFFNKAISASEVTTLYNETTSTTNTLQILGDTSCVAAYTFEGNANDLSTNYNGTATNVIYDYSGTASNVTYTTGKFDKAAVFNGTTSKVTITSPLGVSSSDQNSDFSVSMWLMWDSVSSTSNTLHGTIVGDYAGSNYGSFHIYAYGLGTGNGLALSFERYFNSTGYYNSGYATVGTLSNIQANQWHHVAHTYVGSTKEVKLYLDGTLIVTYTLNLSAGGRTTNSYNTFGDYDNRGSYGHDGKMDQIRLFDKTLSPGEVNSLYNETTTTAALTTISNPSTIAYYKMADAADETGSYNGTASNVDFNIEGKYGFAGKFNGSSSLIAIGSPIPNTDTNTAISAWVNLNNGISGHMHITGTGITTAASEAPFRATLSYVSSNTFKIFALRQVGGTYYYAGTSGLNNVTINPNVWYHVVWSYDATGRQLSTFLNGVAVDSNVAMSTTGGSVNNSTTVIGSFRSTSGPFFDGKLDQIRIFNKTISADEVTKLYNEIQCANTITTPENYFNTKLYTGTGSAQSITGVGFQPDFVWTKVRSTTNSHHLYDSVRGINSGTSSYYEIYSDLTAAQGAYANTLTGLNANGFSVGSAASNNNSGQSFVAWNWKAAASNATNNDGTIASTVRASQESGFSVVKWTGSGTNGDTVGHGLAPAGTSMLVIMKDLGAANDWMVITNNLWSSPNQQYLKLNTTAGVATSGADIYNVNNTTFKNDYRNTSGNDHIAYCFANVDGYQRIGSYVGTASTGPFVYTGFEPAWLMIKEASNTGNWCIYDNKRDTVNPNNVVLAANSNNAESSYSSGYNVNFHTNGFEIAENASNDLNTSGSTYIFMAIAANPDTTAPTKANSFKTKIYTGNGGTQSITGLGFKPDLTWVKNRSTTGNHSLIDSVRGTVKPINSNTSGAEQNYPGFTLTSFLNDGFSVTDNSDGLYGWNGPAGSTYGGSTGGYVSWNWKALDHDRNLAAINNNGTIPSIVSANPAAGFSIVNYTSTTNSSDTVGHGLSLPPKLYITKRLGTAASWWTYTTVIDGSLDYMALDRTDSKYNSTKAAPTSSVFTTDYGSVDNIITYCWHSVAGYSKIGTYSGTGSNGNAITNVGFQPSFILIKRTDAADNWSIVDDKRGNNALFPDLASQELSNSGAVVFNTDGFTINGSAGGYNNGSGTYLYMAIK